MKKSTILVTGASSGLGKDCAATLVKEGYEVYGVARRLEQMDDIKSLGVNTIKIEFGNSISVVCYTKMVPLPVTKDRSKRVIVRPCSTGHAVIPLPAAAASSLAGNNPAGVAARVPILV